MMIPQKNITEYVTCGEVMNNDLIIKFKNSLNAFPEHEQEIRYFQQVSGGYDSFGYELAYTTVEYSIAELQDGDYTGTFISYEGNEALLEDKEHYELFYGDLPSQFYWIDLEDYFNIFLKNKFDK